MQTILCSCVAALPLIAVGTFQNHEEHGEGHWWLKRLRGRKNSQAFFLAEDLDCLCVLSLSLPS